MRYYAVALTDPTTNAVLHPKSQGVLDPSFTYTSYAGGQTLPGALNLELDVQVVPFATPAGAAFVRVWGVSLQELAQSSDLNGVGIQVYAGFQRGLPLANPAQAGLIFQGSVFQAFGNWIDVDQTLDLIVQPSLGTIAAPANLVVNWPAGETLGTALRRTLATAYPGYSVDDRTSAKLVLNHDEVGYYQTPAQLAQFVQTVSRAIVGGSYPGVSVVLKEKTFQLFDGTSTTTPKQLQFQDLIGQPTWLDAPTIQVKCAMRADVAVGDFIKLPPSLATTTAQSFSQFRARSVFQGTFQVSGVRHVGNYRQCDAASWVTVLDAYPVTG